MSGLIHLLDDCLLPLFTLTTVLLAIGCGLMGLMRSPAHRQRTGELTLAAIFGWWFLACLPLPRLLPEQLWTRPYLRFRSAAVVQEPTSDGGRRTSLMSDWDVDSDARVADLRQQDGAVPDAKAGPEAGRLDLPSHDSASAEIVDALIAGTGRLQINGGKDTPRHAPSVGVAPASRLPWIAIIYLAGAAGSVVWLACGGIRLACIRRTARRPPAWLTEMFAALAEEADQRPRLLISRQNTGPMSWGIWRPTIVLPQSLVRRRHREQLRMVLLHELAHVVRRDGCGNGLLCLALPLLYPHPLFLWLRAQIRLAAELLADDWAAGRGGKLDYVEQLVVLARSSARSPDLLPIAGAVTLYSSSSQFYRRMQMLISRTCPLSAAPTARWRLSSLAVAVLSAVMAASMAGVRPASGQQPPSDPAALRPDASGRVPATPATPSPTAKESTPKSGLEQLQELPGVGRLFISEKTTPEAPANAEEQALRARLAAAEDRIRLLEARLRKSVANEIEASPSGKATPQQANQITVTHVEQDGTISHETWTTTEDGRPGKLVSKTTGRPDESRIGAVRTTVSPSGRIAKEFVDKDGTVTTQVYDRDTGRLMEMRRATRVEDPASATATDVAEHPKTPAPPSIGVAELSPRKPGGPFVGHDSGSPSSATMGPDAAGLDLVKLATAYADALGAVEEAEARITAGGSEGEMALAKAAVRNAKRKQELLGNLASVAADAARADLEQAQQLVRKGFATPASTTAAESRLKMLNTILQSGSAAEGDSKQPGRSPATP